VKFPPQYIIDRIDDFCVLYFKDIEHSKEAPAHFYLTFPIADDRDFVICIITSKVEKRERYYRRKNAKALKALVHVNNDIFEFLERFDSVIDCNRSELLTKSELVKRIDPRWGIKVRERAVPQFIKKEVMSAILQSPLIAPNLKKIIKANIKC